MNLRALALLLLSGLTSLAQAMPLPQEALVPGGVAIVLLGEQASPAPVASYDGHEVMTVYDAGRWKAVVGIALATAPGPQALQVSRGTASTTVHFSIHAKDYPAQHLTLKNLHQVNPTAAELKRIRSESARSHAALNRFSEQPLVLRLNPPIHGRMSSAYGLRRFFNGQPRKPHSGWDIAAAKGTPVRAPAAGIVAEEGHFFFDGNVVFLDHGHGLVTMYCHLSKIEVKKGQHIEAGQVIGLVGMTGRATGPHLHWGVSLNGNMVNPALLVTSSPFTRN